MMRRGVYVQEVPPEQLTTLMCRKLHRLKDDRGFPRVVDTLVGVESLRRKH